MADTRTVTPAPVPRQENGWFAGDPDARLRSWFDTTGTAMLLADGLNGRILDVNPAFLALLGWTEDDLADRHVWEVAPLDRVAPDAATVRSLGAGAMPELDVTSRDGRRLYLDVRWDAFRAGPTAALAIQLWDASERRDAERRRRDAESRASRADKMRAVAQVAGHAAHRLNNLLGVILGYTEIAMSRLRPGDPLLEDLGHALRTGEKASSFTGSLLAFGRTTLVDPALVDVDDLVRENEAAWRRMLGDRALVLSLGTVGPVLAEPPAVERALTALVANAKAALPEGGTVTVSTSAVDLDPELASRVGVTAGSWVAVSVRDTGPGMDAAVQSRLFEPFFSTHGGPGLGLAGVWATVRQAGGHVTVDSAPGRGTTFTLHLPRVLTDEAPTPRDALPSVAGGTETILVVDDDDDVRGLARKAIASAGYQVLTAASGPEALLLCERYPGTIHLVVADLLMPHMTGDAFARRLAAIRPRAKIVYVSGFAADVPRDRAPRLVTKPFHPAELTAAIRHVLDE